MFHGILIGIMIATAAIVIAEIELDYSLGDWLKDHALALFGLFQTFEHAKLAGLKARAARLELLAETVKAKIDSKLKKLEFWK
jgi:hypothetical protein